MLTNRQKKLWTCGFAITNVTTRHEPCVVFYDCWMGHAKINLRQKLGMSAFIKEVHPRRQKFNRVRSLFAKYIWQTKDEQQKQYNGRLPEKALAHQCWPPSTHKHNRLACIIRQKKRKKNNIGKAWCRCKESMYTSTGVNRVKHGWLSNSADISTLSQRRSDQVFREKSAKSSSR